MKPTRSEMGFRRWAAMLFDQQMWCLGRDIVRTHGNILLDLGMCQYRSPNPNRGSTLYTAAVEPGGSLFLWGFGAMYTEPSLGGVFVRRNDFAPKWTPRETALGIHDANDLGRLVTPVTGREMQTLHILLPRLVNWFAKYEHWIAENFGTRYREECLAGRTKTSVVPAQDMARSWERATKQCKHCQVDTSQRGVWAPVLKTLQTSASIRSAEFRRPSTRVAN